MADRDTAEQIAKELMVALVASGKVSVWMTDGTKTGNYIGDVYRAILAKVLTAPGGQAQR